MFCTYEQVTRGSRFGETMLKNLQARGCPLLACAKYASLEEQENRYKSQGWVGGAKAWTLNEIYGKIISEDEGKRIASLELLDELEEFRLIHDHYLLLVATGNQKY